MTNPGRVHLARKLSYLRSGPSADTLNKSCHGNCSEQELIKTFRYLREIAQWSFRLGLCLHWLPP